jgi:anaerobic magnesium-protoporphyrin IX monomethyl ester cyclase
MTFSHGDYARIGSVMDSMTVARELYQQALSRQPDHRAFWGLALVHQQYGQWESAIEMLDQGLRHFPQSQHLNICLGIGYVNIGQYRKALSHLMPFEKMPDAIPHIIRCLHALGRGREVEKYILTNG